MARLKFIYYREENRWVGWLEEFPEYRTQGAALAELKENLRDIYLEISGGKFPPVWKVGELIVE